MSSSSESSVSAQLVQRAKSSGKLRFGKDKLLRTNSGGGRSPLPAAASSTSLASSDGEELTSWRVEARAAATSARREQPDDDPFATTRSASAPVSRRTVQPPDTWACTSLADLDILATIGGSLPKVQILQHRIPHFQQQLNPRRTGMPAPEVLATKIVGCI